jgi:hypothetical protein
VSPLSVAARMDTHFGAQCRQVDSATVTEVLLLLDSDLCLHESTDNRICVLDKLFLLVAFCRFRICNCFLKISKSPPPWPLFKGLLWNSCTLCSAF